MVLPVSESAVLAGQRLSLQTRAATDSLKNWIKLTGGYTFYDAALAPARQFLWTVFDDATAKKYKWDTKYPTCEEGHAFTAGTLAELAKLTNQPNLEKTVARYNGFVDTKKDEDFLISLQKV